MVLCWRGACRIAYFCQARSGYQDSRTSSTCLIFTKPPRHTLATHLTYSHLQNPLCFDNGFTLDHEFLSDFEPEIVQNSLSMCDCYESTAPTAPTPKYDKKLPAVSTPVLQFQTPPFQKHQTRNRRVEVESSMRIFPQLLELVSSTKTQPQPRIPALTSYHNTKTTRGHLCSTSHMQISTLLRDKLGIALGRLVLPTSSLLA